MITADQLIAQLMQDRGIDLSRTPSFNDLRDPLLLGQMPAVIDRVRRAIDRHEKIGIIGDYDADGITGTAQMVRCLRRHGNDPQIIFPDRQKHGYGMKREFIDAFHANGITLLITIDMGITYAEEIKYARLLGMDVVVMDHHEQSAMTPDAFILHPQFPNPNPNPNPPCASGVVFTFLRAFENGEWDGMETDVALAAIGTVADVVQLRGENRTIVQLGLDTLCKGDACITPTVHNNPLTILARSCVRKGMPVTAGTIGYRIAPRINAAGRIAQAELALDALLNGGDAIEKLNALNEQRQQMTEDHLQKALEDINPLSCLISHVSHLSHPGIVGLTAGKLTERTGKPSCIGAEHDGAIHCSLRGIPEYHIAHALERCDTHLTSHGGHAMAGGCTLKASDWDDFSRALATDAAEHLNEIDLAPRTEIDAVIDPSSLTTTIVQELQKLEPFGEGNREPTVLIRNATIGNIRAVGKEAEHLQCRVNGIKGIGFGLAARLPRSDGGSPINQFPEHADIVCRLGVDTWNGMTGVQLFVEDIGVPQPDEDAGYLALVEQTHRPEWNSPEDNAAFRSLQ